MTLTYTINKPVHFVFDYLTDMQKFVSVHPVITKITPLGNSGYLVYETLKIACIPFSFTYPVMLESKWADKMVTIRATVMRLTKIAMTFRIIEQNTYSIIEETIDFESPLPVQSIMEGIFKKQHGRLFQNIASLKGEV